MKNERGSALIITLMLLLILTAIGVYAITTATTEIDVTLQSKVGTATLNAAEAGTYFGIDRIPGVILTSSPATLTFNPGNQTSYSVTSGLTGSMTLRAGYGANYRFADFAVTSVGNAPPQFVAQKTVQAVINYGPVPVGTMY